MVVDGGEQGADSARLQGAHGGHTGRGGRHLHDDVATGVDQPGGPGQVVLDRYAPRLDEHRLSTSRSHPGHKLRELLELVTWVRATGAETVFVQAWGVTVEDYLTCAAGLVDTCGDVVVKVPATPAGVAAVRSLETGGVRTLLTAVYNHVQVVPAIIAGATYLAPYLGRMNDAGLDGVAEIAQMQTG